MPINTSPFFGSVTLGPIVDKAYTTEDFPVGTCQMDNFGNQYMFVSFAEDTSIGDPLTVTVAGAASVATSSRLDGVAIIASSTGEYGWIGIHGDFANCAVATGLAINEFISYVTNGSDQMAEVSAVDEAGSGTYVAGSLAVRGVVISAPSSNVASVRLF